MLKNDKFEAWSFSETVRTWRTQKLKEMIVEIDFHSDCLVLKDFEKFSLKQCCREKIYTCRHHGIENCSLEMYNFYLLSQKKEENVL